MISSEHIPRSILIIGSGVFGLSTVYSLCKNILFKNVEITLVDRAEFPASDGASVGHPFNTPKGFPAILKDNHINRLTRLVLFDLVSPVCLIPEKIHVHGSVRLR